MDSLETNETTALEQPSEIKNEQVTEPVAEAVAEQPEEVAAQPEAELPVQADAAEQEIVQQTFQTKEEVVARVQAIVESGEAGDRNELALLKQLFYRFHNAEVQEAFKAFVEAGGEEEALPISILQLKNLTLGYTFPSKWMEKAHIEKLRIYFSGDNLLTFSPIYKHTSMFDPEAIGKGDSDFSDGGNAVSETMGDGYTYPTLRSFSIGINLTF